MRETSRSLDAMYYDYDAIIIIIFITIHTTAKVKYTDIRNFIGCALSLFHPLAASASEIETDDSSSVVGGCNLRVSQIGSSGRPLLLISHVINPVAIRVFIVLCAMLVAIADYRLELAENSWCFLDTYDRISPRILLRKRDST